MTTESQRISSIRVPPFGPPEGLCTVDALRDVRKELGAWLIRLLGRTPGSSLPASCLHTDEVGDCCKDSLLQASHASIAVLTSLLFPLVGGHRGTPSYITFHREPLTYGLSRRTTGLRESLAQVPVGWGSQYEAASFSQGHRFSC